MTQPTGIHCISQYKLGSDVLTLRVSCDALPVLLCPADGHFDFGGVVYDGGRSWDHANKSGNPDRDLPLGTFNETVYINDTVFGLDVGGFYCQDVDADYLCGEDGEPAVLFCGHANLGVIDTTKFAWAGYYVVGPLFQQRNCPGTANPIGGTIGTLSIWLTPDTGGGPGTHGSLDYGVWGMATADRSRPNPPHTPSDFNPASPQVGPSLNQCNNGGPTPPQEFGHGTGDADDSGGTDYHRYINDNTIGGLDSCIATAGTFTFAECAVETERQAVNDSINTTLAGPLPGSISAGAGILVSQTGNVVAGGACGGIGGTGTDGEFEYGSNAAFLNVRETAGANGGDGLRGCYNRDVTPNMTDNCGDNAAEGCLSDEFVKGSEHHAGDTTVVVMDAVFGGYVGFTVASDWSRPNATSTGGQNGNTIHGQKHCGDGVIEPCRAGAFPGLVNRLRRGETAQFLADASSLTALPQSEKQLDEWNQRRVGCNPLDYAEYNFPRAYSAPSNTFDPSGATLKDFGLVGYTGGAAGYLIVLIGWDNPGGVIHQHADTGFAAAGWVWTF